MLYEFNGSKQVSYRVNSQHGGNIEMVNEIYAADYFKGMGGDTTNTCVAPINSNINNNTNADSCNNAASSFRLRRRIQATLERIFLPAGYPNSVTDDLLTFAMWDAAQVLATNVMSTLSTRAVLLGVGVGESGANLTSSTLSWMMRDGTWLIGSIFFASVISQDLEYRAKTWRLVADFTNDAAAFLELCAPLFPGGQLMFRLVVVIASVARALVGVCGGGTRASFTQHFALRSNAADVAAKAGTRGNVGSLVGLALGVVVAFIVPASSTVLNLAVFVLSTTFHLFANYQLVRSVQLRHLNAPRLEWCCERFLRYQEQLLIAEKKETGPQAVKPVLDVSVRRANAAEQLFILPALPAPPPAQSGVRAAVCRFFRVHCCPPSLRLRIHCGASFLAVLTAQTCLTAARKQGLVQRVEESLAARGIALLFDEVSLSYYMILPEFYTAEGVPESWVRYKRQYDANQLAEAKHRSKHRASTGRAGRSNNSAEEYVDAAGESYRTTAQEADEEARAEIERVRRERVIVPPHVLPLAYRELWAFFYAYVHYRVVCERRERGLPHANAVLTADNRLHTGNDRHANSTGAASAFAPEPSTLHLISHLRADGVLEEGTASAFNGEGGAVPSTMTMVDADLFREMTSPTSTTSSRAWEFSRGTGGSSGVAGDGSQTAHIAPQDGLYPLFIDFVRSLRKTGWELDRLLIDNEGCTTVVQYL